MATVLTSRNHAITLQVNGNAIPGYWKKFEGGKLTAQTTVNRPGGMADRMVIASTAERDTVTITRDYDYTRDDALIGPGAYLDQGVEEGWVATVVVQRLNSKKQPVGTAKSYTGVISAADPPPADSEGTETLEYSVEITIAN